MAATDARDAHDLYLDLLARSLTGLLAAERWSLTMPPRGPIRARAWAVVGGLLGRRGLALARRAYDPDRSTGYDWPLSGETMVGLRRLESLRSCIETILRDGVPGDVLEAGVWRGGAAIFMKGVLTANGDEQRAVWVADSFDGLPKPDPAYPADRGDWLWQLRELAVPLDEVRGNFERYGLLDDRVRFVPGWFRDTLPGLEVQRLALLRIDADMYESTIVPLRALYAKVPRGGYVVVDDYGALDGCRAAVDDFRRDENVVEPLEWVDPTCVLWRRT